MGSPGFEFLIGGELGALSGRRDAMDLCNWGF